MSGVFGKQNLTASTWTEVIPAPSSGTRVATLTVCNRNSVSAIIRVAIVASTSPTPTDSDIIEYDVSIPANGVLERTGIVIDSQNKVMVRAASSGVSAVGYGIAGV